MRVCVFFLASYVVVFVSYISVRSFSVENLVVLETISLIIVPSLQVCFVFESARGFNNAPEAKIYDRTRRLESGLLCMLLGPVFVVGN